MIKKSKLNAEMSPDHKSGRASQLGTMERIALRLDDVGASSKKYEIYSNHSWKVCGLSISANWLFLKYLNSFKCWGPYRELIVDEWFGIYDLLEKYGAKLTVAVTAAWVKSNGCLIPFPERFPEEATALKEGLDQGLIEIANHGLTHCVLKNNLFKPKWFSSNRSYHREFWDWLPYDVQKEHINRSQDILQGWFGTDIVTFVPPGNVFTDATLEIAQKYGLRYVSCSKPPKTDNDFVIISGKQVVPFHDRDIVINGIEWLREQLVKRQDKQFCFIGELGESIIMSANQAKLPES